MSEAHRKNPDLSQLLLFLWCVYVSFAGKYGERGRDSLVYPSLSFPLLRLYLLGGQVLNDEELFFARPRTCFVFLTAPSRRYLFMLGGVLCVILF